MKTTRSALVRALCSIIIGVLLIKYRDQAVTWMTIAIGVLFLISGVISCASYFASRRSEPVVSDDPSVKPMPSAPFPIVGIGSLVLGIILAGMPTTFVSWLMYILAAILILGAVGQFVALASTMRIARVGVFFWIMPTLIFLVGLVALVKPSWMASAPLLVLGWCMVVYGLSETINAIQTRRLRRYYERQAQQLANVQDAEVVEEVADEAQPENV